MLSDGLGGTPAGLRRDRHDSHHGIWSTGWPMRSTASLRVVGPRRTAGIHTVFIPSLRSG